MKPHVLKKLALDVLLTGVCLCLFALFHHVLPMRSGAQPLAVIKIATSEPAATAATAEPDATQTPAQAVAQVETRASASGREKRSSKTDRGASSGEKGGSALEDVETTDTPLSAVPLAQAFANVLDGETAKVTVSKEQTVLDSETITYYIADIYLSDITRLQTVLAQDTYGTGYRESLTDMAIRGNAIIAINGDYYGNTSEGVVIRNGVVYRANPTDCDLCVLYQDGTMKTMSADDFDLAQAIADGAWQAWTFGPALLDQSGGAIESFDSTRRLIAANPRSAIGYYAPGHYCFVVVDGRDEGYSSGMTLPQLSQLFESLGCKAAYNLDGGNSSIMVSQGEILNQPSGGGREISDCILITEAK